MENRTHTPIELPSGLTLLVVERPNSKAFAASLTLPVGENDAPDEYPQLAHLVEHLAFLGENCERVEFVNAQGGDVNACTTDDFTQFQAHGHIELIESALRFLLGVLNPTAISGDDLMRERRVLAKEYVQNGPGGLSSCDFLSFQQSRRLRGAKKCLQSLAQHQKCLDGISEAVVNRFRETHYLPDSARLVIVSALPPSAIVELLPPLDRLPAAQQSESRTSAPPAPVVERNHFVWNGHRSSWLKVTYRSDDTSPFHDVVGRLLEDHLGNGQHSPFFKHLRQDLGKTYSVDVDFSRLFDRSLFEVSLAIDKRDVADCMTWIIQQLDLLAEQGLTAATYERLRSRFLRKQDLWFEGPWQVATYLGAELLREESRQLLTPESYWSLAAGATLETVNRELRRLLAAENRYVTIVGPMRMLSRWRLRRQLAKLVGSSTSVDLES